MEYYWKKKTVVSYILAMLVVAIHNHAIYQYMAVQAEADGVLFYINSFADKLFSMTVSQVAVPLFFIISGATFFRNYKREMYKKKLASRVKSLVIPYFVWNILGMLFLILCSYTSVSQYFVGRERFAITVPNVIEAIFFYKCKNHFWFIYCLIIFVILTPVFDFLTSKKWMAYLFVLFSLMLPLFAEQAFAAVRVRPDSVVFYALGCLIGKYYFKDFIKLSRKRTQIISGFVCLVCVALQLLDLYDFIHLNIITRQLLLIAFCFAFWWLMDSVATHIQTKPFMNDSFVLYALHGDVQSILVKIVFLAGPHTLYMAIPNFLVSYVGTIVLICIFAWLLKKRLPPVYAVISGNR